MPFHSLRANPPSRSIRVLTRCMVPLLLSGGIGTVAAQEPLRNLLAFGAISIPEFEGSSDKTAAPLLIGRLDFGSHGSLRIAGASAQYNLLGEKSDWAFGPVVSFRAARDADVEDTVVRRLREVDAVTEFGVFAEYSLRDLLTQGDRIGLGVEAKGGKGNQFSLTASYQAAKQGAFQFGLEARAVFANDAYMDRYFSVDVDNSARSGLPQYTAGSGAKSVGLAFTGTYDVARDWVVIGRVGFTRLLGDARDSPIVQLRGDPNAASAGLGLGYRF